MNLGSIVKWLGRALIAAVVIALAAGVYWLVAVAIPAGYADPRTGFGEIPAQANGAQRAKTLWDWMQLVLVPLGLVLATIGLGFIQERNRRLTEDERERKRHISEGEHERERLLSEDTARELEAERAREAALQAYLNDIGQLVRADNLGDEPPKIEKAAAKARRKRILALAQAKTNAIFAVLGDDNTRRIYAVEFLGRAGLISRHGIDMAFKNLSGANLAGSAMKGASLARANLQGAKLDEAELQGAGLSGADLQWANLETANLQEANLETANLQRATLDEADLLGADLVHAFLLGAHLHHANLQGAGLSYVNLQGAYLVGTNLQGADLFGTNLQGADLRNTNLREAGLSHANLRGAALMFADLRGADLADATFDKETTLPDLSMWTPDTERARFTDPNHPDFWEGAALII